MSPKTPKTTFLKDYTPSDYLIDNVALRFELGEEETIVTSRLAIRRNPKATTHKKTTIPLILDGRGLILDSISMNDNPMNAEDYTADSEHLTIPKVPEHFTLGLVNRIRPQDNSALEGLYQSNGNFCTQCEAEGFRKITYFLDRPDVLAKYTTTIVADRERYPVLLSNGNIIQSGKSDNNRHWVRREDPYPKPCYLFALVAGDLVSLRDRFMTRSKREVQLSLYVQKHNLDKCDHAMQSLKKAMAWDEEVFGLEYDLDEYMIVAVDDFNMGAMENKGLNIFNARYVLAKPETATDNDYAAIEEVIAHEYFHNWTGNRITCRDWFQLSLKEGLTVFRDQEFSASLVAHSIKRIQDVRLLRETQFAEDASAMAHPVRPESYMEISNFYTATVYNKGAEVIRMMKTLLGKEGFLRGMELYIRRHDGEAATIDDFILAMEEANQTNLQQFRRWYNQAGTPEVAAQGQYNPKERTYTLTFHQSCRSTPDQSEKKPFHIPIAIGLIDKNGQDLPLEMAGEKEASPPETRVLSLRETSERFQFIEVPHRPIPSLLREFSAPITLKTTQTIDDLAFLLTSDSDPFARWDAGQALVTRLALDLITEYQEGRRLKLDRILTEVFEKTLLDGRIEEALIAELLTLPTEMYLGTQMKCIDVDAIHSARQFIRYSLADSLKDRFLDVYHRYKTDRPYRYGSNSAGERRLKNLCLAYLMELPDPEIQTLCFSQFEHADNMTDTLAALALLANTDCAERQKALDIFETRWCHDPLVMDKWFTVQATSKLPNTLQVIKELMGHTAFSLKNPNKVRALIGAFCQRNQVRFHEANGTAYTFLVDQVLILDAINPQIAARLLNTFNRWRNFDFARQKSMNAEIDRVLIQPGLSKDTYEIASKMLA